MTRLGFRLFKPLGVQINQPVVPQPQFVLQGGNNTQDHHREDPYRTTQPEFTLGQFNSCTVLAVQVHIRAVFSSRRNSHSPHRFLADHPRYQGCIEQMYIPASATT